MGAADALSAAASILAMGSRTGPSNATTKSSVLPAALAAGVAACALALGFVVAVLLSGQMRPVEYGYDVYRSSLHLASGLAMGAAAWTAGRLLSAAARADSGYVKFLWIFLL